VDFRWEDRAPCILSIDSLSVERGKRILIRGPSGSGKTTLLNLLAGVVTPDSGRIEVLGTDLAGLRGHERDRFRVDHIGFVFQMFNLIPYLSLLENVTLPCRFSAKRRKRAAAAGEASITAEARRLLTELELDVALLGDREVTRLSVGQQQRVAVARALIGRPELVICDEPTSALDDDTRESFLRLLFLEIEAAGATLVFVSHDASFADHFDQTIDLQSINKADGGY
jgi:putative ABC transport system ATP-binding protein